MTSLCGWRVNKVFSSTGVVFVDRETSHVHCVFMVDNKLNEKYVNHMDSKKKECFYKGCNLVHERAVLSHWSKNNTKYYVPQFPLINWLKSNVQMQTCTITLYAYCCHTCTAHINENALVRWHFSLAENSC